MCQCNKEDGAFETTFTGTLDDAYFPFLLGVPWSTLLIGSVVVKDAPIWSCCGETMGGEVREKHITNMAEVWDALRADLNSDEMWKIFPHGEDSFREAMRHPQTVEELGEYAARCELGRDKEEDRDWDSYPSDFPRHYVRGNG